VCVKYRTWVHSRDGWRWEVKERWRRRRNDEDVGGCIKQQVADALWELAGRFEVGLWYGCGAEAVSGVYMRHCCERRKASPAVLPYGGGVRRF